MIERLDAQESGISNRLIKAPDKQELNSSPNKKKKKKKKEIASLVVP